MNDITWEELAPYLHKSRHSDEEAQARGEQIVDFLQRQMKCANIGLVHRGVGQPGWDNGSCTKFYLYFDDEWNPLPADLFAQKHSYILTLAVSERGPFIISAGFECVWKPAEFGGDGGKKLYPQENGEANDKAQVLALAVARTFELKYLNSEWLRGYKLDEESLPVEVQLSLDYSEPDALNVLFDEQL